VTQQLLLLVTAAIGLPLMLLAVGVLAHAYLLARPRRAAASEGVPPALIEAMVAESVDQLLAQLRITPGALDNSPSLSPDSPSGLPLVPATSSMAVAPSMVATPLRVATSPSGANLLQAVAQLVSEGLSDRSIARRLSVGIEEVRIARAPLAGPR
jgi:hypothetical protein